VGPKRVDFNRDGISLRSSPAFGSGAVQLLNRLCHPERSRFSGVAKDLPLDWLIAQAQTAPPPGFLRFLRDQKAFCH
jgi:hypothetical protein